MKILDKDHLLGNLRLPAIIFVGGLFTAFYLAYYESSFRTLDSNGIIRLVFVISGSLVCGWILTTEAIIRFFLSAVAASIIAVIFGFILKISKSAFNWHIADPESELLYLAGAVFLVFIVSIFGVFSVLRSSKIFGIRCPACKERGTISEETIDKTYLGKSITPGTYYQTNVGGHWHREKHPDKVTNKYLVRTRHICSACEHEWESTHETTS